MISESRHPFNSLFCIRLACPECLSQSGCSDRKYNRLSGLKNKIIFHSWRIRNQKITVPTEMMPHKSPLLDLHVAILTMGFSGSSMVRICLPVWGDLGVWVQSLGPGAPDKKWQPNQYSCLGKPMDKEETGGWATVHRIAKSRTQLNNWAHRRLPVFPQVIARDQEKQRQRLGGVVLLFW